MRIIRGSHRGKQINPPKNFKARPTTDYAKESIFNIIENNFDISELKVLDLFGGTGSISYEFASRGCEDVTTVEINPRHASFIKNNAREIGFKQIQVIKGSFFSFVNNAAETYDLIFADPPYDLERIEVIPDEIFEKELLNEDGWLIVEHSENTDYSGNQYFLQHRKYGKVNFTIFSKKNER